MKTTTPTSLRSMREAGLLSQMASTAFLITVAIGTTLVCVFFFHDYSGQLAVLAATDLRLDQAIYAEAVARLTRDMSSMQFQARMQSDLDADIAARTSKHAALDQGRQETTRLRLEGDQDIADRLASEIADRAANDTLTQQRIDNATAVLAVLESFDAYTLAQFMIKMNNITDITSDILAEIAARTGIDMALMVQDAIIENALVILVSELNADSIARLDKDMLVMNQLGLLTGSLLRTINYQNPFDSDIQLVSITPATVEVTNGTSASQIVVRAFGIMTVAGVPPNAGGNIAFVAGQGITIDYPSPNTVRFSATSGGTLSPPDYIRLSRVFPFGQDTQWVQGGNSNFWDTLRDGGANCNTNADCDLAHPPPTYWTCQNGFATGNGGQRRCRNNNCLGPLNCGIPQPGLGTDHQAWSCVTPGQTCRKLFCTDHTDCHDAFNDGNWRCQNHRCTRGFAAGDGLPAYVDTYPSGSGNIHRNLGTPVSGQKGYQNANGNNANVIGSRPPYPNAQFSQGTGCTFPAMYGQMCGFRTHPSIGAIWLVHFTVTIRIATTNLLHINSHYFRMYIDAGSGWEHIETEYVGQKNTANPGLQTNYVYVVMTATRLFHSPVGIPFGTVVYLGWSCFFPFYDMANYEMFVTWYRLSYDIAVIR